MKPKFVDCFVLLGTALSMNTTIPPNNVIANHPLISEDFTTFINVSLTVQSVRFANLNDMEAEVISLFHQRWFDARLGSTVQKNKIVTAGQIWQPKTTLLNGYIQNEEDMQFWRGYGEEGRILQSQKFLMKLYCTKDFSKFPFDSQVCQLKFGTYRFPIDEVFYQWNDVNPVEILSGVNVDEFTILNVSTFHEIEIRQSGDFSVVVLQVTLKRCTLHYIICIMVPCVLLTLINYICMWLKEDSATRFNISFCTTLFLIYFFNQSFCKFGFVSNLKALDIFVLVNLFFGTTTVFENYLVQLFEESDFSDSFNSKECEIRLKHKCMRIMETFIRIAYPLFYISTIIVYCFYVC